MTYDTENGTKTIPNVPVDEDGNWTVKTPIDAKDGGTVTVIAKDPAGNLVIRRAASPGMEHAPSVVLQSHVDMVCEKNSGVAFDFLA